MKRSISMILLGALVAAAACSAAACVEQPDENLAPKPPNPDQTIPISDVPGVFAGDDDNTHSHMGDLGDQGARDPFDILAQRQEEGPPEIRTRLHSCQKVQITALRNMLSSLGVNLDATGDPPTAGQLIGGAAGALGAATYDARVGETIVWSAAGAAKLFDIFVQAAPEIIANLPNVDQCKVDGVGAQLFNGDACNADGIACIIGRPATATHVAVCNEIVKKASSPEVGKKIAVATLMSGAHSCE